MPQPNPEHTDPVFTLAEVIEQGLPYEQDTQFAAGVTARLKEYAARREQEALDALPETVNTRALLDDLGIEEGRRIPEIVRESIARVAARENQPPTEEK